MAATTSTSIRTVTASGIGPVPVTLTERGAGRPFLLLHGGAGPQSVDSFAGLLASSGAARVLAPVHPGFSGTPRPEGLASIKALARVYARLLDDLDLRDVTVAGNSIGGWIAAELALLGSPRVSDVVLVDAVGLRIDAAPVADFFSLTMDQVADLSYYRPDAFRLDLDSLPDQQKKTMAGNRAALLAYGGTAMSDPGLLGRLPAITVPVLAIWGEADGIVSPEHGLAYASAIPGARLVVIPQAGHLPQLEAPDQLLEAIWDFAGHQGPKASTVTVTGPQGGEVALAGPIRRAMVPPVTATTASPASSRARAIAAWTPSVAK